MTFVLEGATELILVHSKSLILLVATLGSFQLVFLLVRCDSARFALNSFLNDLVLLRKCSLTTLRVNR